VLHSASNVQSDLPQAVALRNDLSAPSATLFLDGLADGMQPIQAVGLFYDFQDLTPIGADGDQMVRNLVRRLVDVDLLDEAAKLLKYQVDNRLNGVPKAQVATDLAWIYLMDRKPESALDTINATRTTILPNGAERRAPPGHRPRPDGPGPLRRGAGSDRERQGPRRRGCPRRDRLEAAHLAPGRRPVRTRAWPIAGRRRAS
jgi:hypothetical protein